MDNATSATFTSGLLCGSYLTRDGMPKKSAQVMLTHSFVDGADKTLCKRISADRCAFGGEETAAPTCPLCLKRDPRFAK